MDARRSTGILGLAVAAFAVVALMTVARAPSVPGAVLQAGAVPEAGAVLEARGVPEAGAVLEAGGVPETGGAPAADAVLRPGSDAAYPGAALLQATATDSVEPTEPLPTPIPAPGTPEPLDGCRAGVPSPRFFWTLFVAPHVSGATGMWVPYGESGGPYLRAYVKALYGDVWYGARLDGTDGRLYPDASPPWPRPDIIRPASNGVQTVRVGNPMCGRTAEATLPPCYAELVVPLVFLDRLAPDGPYLRNTYFWAPSNQVVAENGGTSRVSALEYSALACDTRRVGARLPSARPVYAQFSGCSGDSLRIDGCYLIGCGEQGVDCP